jgi:DNA (cytosine-5)-methyltransferase 1
MYKAIDLFAGAGGFSCGFRQAGYSLVKAVELDPIISTTYKKNNESTKLIVDDIKNVDQTDEFKPHEADVIIGGPPCQGFSMAGSRNRHDFMGDPRNFLFKHYFNIVKKVLPKAFVFENVKGLLSMEHGDIFREIKNIFSNKELLNGSSYALYWKIVKAVEFGIPQKRERVILIGVLNRQDIKFDEIWNVTKEEISDSYPHFFDYVTVYDAIGNMPEPTKNGEINPPYPKTDYERFISRDENKIFNHLKSNHSKIAIERMSRIKIGENFQSLDENIKSVHSGSYGRMYWNQPSMTITTRFDTPSGGRFIHPSKNRTITAREAARLQSFPDDYIFMGKKTSVSKQIGNAVPPKLSFFLAKYISNLIGE